MAWMTEDFQLLRAACMSGDREVVLSLLDRGTDQNADPGAPRGWSSLMTAAFYGHRDIAKLLVERGAKLDTIEIDRWWTACSIWPWKQVTRKSRLT